MTKKPQTSKDAAEKVVKNIRRKTRQTYSAEEKIRIVLAGLRGEESISVLCRREGIAEADLPFVQSAGKVRNPPIKSRCVRFSLRQNWFASWPFGGSQVDRTAFPRTVIRAQFHKDRHDHLPCG